MERIKKALLLLFVLSSFAFSLSFTKNLAGLTLWMSTVNAQAGAANAYSLGSYGYHYKRTYATEELPEIGNKIKRQVATIRGLKDEKVNWVPKYYIPDTGAVSSMLVFISSDNKYICFVAAWSDEMPRVFYDERMYIGEHKEVDNSFTDEGKEINNYCDTVDFDIIYTVMPFYQVRNYYAFTAYGTASIFSLENPEFAAEREAKELAEQKAMELELLKQANVICVIEDIHNYVSQFTNEYTNFTCNLWKDDDGTFAGYLIKYDGVGYISDYNKFFRGDDVKSYPVTYQLNIRIYNNGDINYWIRFFDFSGKVKEVKQVWSKASDSLIVHSPLDEEILYLSTDRYTDLLTLLLNFGIDKKYIFTPYNYGEEGYQIYNTVYNFVSSFNKKWPSIFK